MKSHYIALLSLVLLSQIASAQSNDSLRREVTIVKDYTPIVKEASKINSLPPVSTPAFERKPVTYRYDATPAEISITTSNVAIPRISPTTTGDKYRKGYIDFGMGTYMSMAGNAGYHILDNATDRLNIGVQFTSLNWDIPVNSSFVQGPEKESATRQTFYDTRAGLHYDHLFESDVTLAFNAAYRFLNFNYYGTCGNLPGNRSSHPFQWAHNFFVEIKADNSAAVAYDYNQWSITGGYSLYSNRWGAYVPDPSREQHAYLQASLCGDTGSGWSAGAEANIDFLQYNGIYPAGTPADEIIHNPELAATSLQSVFMTELLPHIDWNGSRVHFRAGLRAYISVNDGTIFRFAPDVHFNWEFVNNYFIYANIGGGKRLHTWNDVSQYCIYFDPSQRIPSTYSPLDATGGIRFNIIPEFSFSAYGGYEIAEAALFQAVGQSSQAINWQTLNASCVKAGARIDLNIGHIVSFIADGTYRLWKQGTEEISFDRPRWEANARIKVQPHKRFGIEVGYNMQLGRNYGSLGSLADIHNLQASVTYRPIDILSVFVQGNNLLNRKYDFYYGLAAPRIQVMGGLAVTF